mgnify:CR=1 FL=1
MRWRKAAKNDYFPTEQKKEEIICMIQEHPEVINSVIILGSKSDLRQLYCEGQILWYDACKGEGFFELSIYN